MDFLIAVAAFIVGIVGNLIASEAYDCAPSLARWFIECAVMRLPEHERERYREEWYAHLDECPGKLGKLWHAGQCRLVSTRLSALLVRQTAAQDKISQSAEREVIHWIEYWRVGILSIAVLVLAGVSIFSTWSGLTVFTQGWPIALLVAVCIHVQILLASWMLATKCSDFFFRGRSFGKGSDVGASELRTKLGLLIISVATLISCMSVATFFSLVFYLKAIHPAFQKAAASFLYSGQILKSLQLGDTLAWLALMIVVAFNLLVFFAVLLAATALPSPQSGPAVAG